MEDVLVPFFFFACTFGIIYIVITARNRERMALIERGADINQFYSKPNNSNLFLKFGFLFVGSGLGLMIGMFLFPFAYSPFAQTVVMISSTILFGGIFMILGYFVELKIEKSKNKDIIIK